MSTKKEGTEGQLKDIISHAKAYGFVFPSSEIYDGLQGVYDYGPMGAELKNNLRLVWWQAMTRLHEDIVGIDAAIFMHPTTWKASGHVDSFNDPMIDNKDSKKRYRADVLIEDKAASLDAEGNADAAQKIIADMNAAIQADNLDALQKIITDNNITCPVSGTANWTEVRQFNLMFGTKIGSVANEAETLYLRPETAQGIFVNFLNVQKSARMRIPFGIAQTGKAFRNEIIARQFIFRMREFEQMEMQFFVRPGTEMEWFDEWKKRRLNWQKAIGFPEEKLRFHDHDNLAHYANAATDIEFAFPFGFKEIEGIHSRTDFDLSAHQEYSKKKQQYFDNEINENYVPYVVETSAGLDRLFLAVLTQAYQTETVDQGDKTRERTLLKLHPALAPIKAAVFPLTKKDGLPEKATELYNKMKMEVRTVMEVRDSIGKRYTRQDLIGTPVCITVDHQTLEDNTVTVRYRDSLEQERLPMEGLPEKIAYQSSINRIIEQI